jgi:malate synthase
VEKRRASLSEDQKKGAKWMLAGKLVADMLTGDKLDEFLTSICYPHILTTAFEGTTVPEISASKL